MKTVHAIAVVTVLTTAAVVYAAVGADTPSRPPGVSAQEWAPISDSLGVVLDQALPPAGDTSEQAQPGADVQAERISRIGGDRTIKGSVGGAALIPPISGYLMMKRGNIWQRVILVEPVKGPGPAG